MRPFFPILTTCLLLCARALSASADKPNIIYILCDDLGYGDVKCLGGERSKIATPNIDRLAAGGMIFTEAHSSSSVCSPTRYGILTGRYNWRTHLQKRQRDRPSARQAASTKIPSPRSCFRKTGDARLSRRGHRLNKTFDLPQQIVGFITLPLLADEADFMV